MKQKFDGKFICSERHKRIGDTSYCMFYAFIDGVRTQVAIVHTPVTCCDAMVASERIIVSGELKSGGIVADRVYVELRATDPF